MNKTTKGIREKYITVKERRWEVIDRKSSSDFPICTLRLKPHAQYFQVQVTLFNTLPCVCFYYTIFKINKPGCYRYPHASYKKT